MQMQLGRSAGFTAIYIPRKINSLYQSKLELTLFFFLSYASTAIEFSVLQGHSKDGFLLSALKKLLFQSQEGTVDNLDRGFLVTWSVFQALCRLIFTFLSNLSFQSFF